MKLFKDAKQIIITFSFAFAMIFVILAAPTGKNAMARGATDKITDGVSILDDSYQPNDSFSSVGVYVTYYSTPFMRLISEVSNKVTVYSKQESNVDSEKMSQLQKMYSYERSIISSYSAAIKYFDEFLPLENPVELVYNLKGYYVSKRPSEIREELNIADVITKDGSIDLLTTPPFKNSSGNFIITNNDITLKDGTNKNLSVSDNIILEPAYEITHTKPKISYEKGLNDNSGGPSAGLIQALQIYYTLTNQTTENLKIAGTGTIDVLGNVGLIGGAKHKLGVIKQEKFDVFIIHPQNYFGKKEGNKIITEDISNIKYNKKRLKILIAETLEEAVEKLNNHIVGENQ